jgi:hypothetical protein
MKLDILFHYEIDQNTGEIKYIGKEELYIDSKQTPSTKKSKQTKIEEDPTPLITLDPNKLILTSGAVQLLNASTDCRIDVKYKKKDKISVPVIGTDIAFGSKSGNKLTKSNTVSYRGAANDKLSEFGSLFKLEPTENEGIFYLIGDKPIIDTTDEVIDIESELDLKSLDLLDLEKENDSLDFSF